MIASVLWMDGYGPFVWSAWAIALAGLAIMFTVLFADNERTRRELDAISRREKETRSNP